MEFVVQYFIASIFLFLLFKDGTGRRTQQKFRQDCVCGKDNENAIGSRIINGRLTDPNQYPWMVYLTNDGDLYCGGAILNDAYIITAGHCIHEDDIQAKDCAVVVGAHDVFKRGDGVVHNVSKFILHHQFTRHEDYDDNDIGLIKLKTRIQFTRNIRPLCLPDPRIDYTNKLMTIAGWGITEKRRLSRYLLHTKVRTRTTDQCQRSPVGKSYKPTENLCAYGHRTDSCQGDSGSPMFYKEAANGIYASHWVLPGIVSWGEGCATMHIPGVYVNVSNYMNWILTHSSEGYYCKPELIN